MTGTTVLGADDLAGVTAIYEALRKIREQGSSHRPVELLFTTGEELYCKGANAFDFSNIRSRSAYVLDLSGEIGSAAYAAPTLLSFEARIQGRASPCRLPTGSWYQCHLSCGKGNRTASAGAY